MTLIVMDTNVIMSALLTPRGKAARVLRMVLAQKVGLALDARIYSEYREVARRPKFALDTVKTEMVLGYLYEIAVKINALPQNVRLPDPDDAMFYEVAVSAPADFLVTGNRRHFPARTCRKVAVISPEESLQPL